MSAPDLISYCRARIGPYIHGTLTHAELEHLAGTFYVTLQELESCIAAARQPSEDTRRRNR